MITFSLITPEKTVFQDEAVSVSLPTSTGQIQVLKNHVPLVSILAPGELKIVHKDGTEKFLAVSAGYIEVRAGGEVVVLANTAELATDIDIDRAEAARARAKALLTEKIHDDQEYASAAAAIEKEFARLRVARKHRSRVSPLGEGVKRNLQ